MSNFIKFIDFPPFPLFGFPWAAVIPQTDLSVGVLAVLYQSSWYLLKLATRAPPRPAAGPTAGPPRENAPPLAARIPQTGPRVILDEKMKIKYKVSEWNSL